MEFRQWFENQEPEQHPYNNFERQRWFPFIQQANDAGIDPKKILRYKSPDTYAKAAQRGGRSTEISAEKVAAQRINSPLAFFDEKIVKMVPNAVVVPGYELPPSDRFPQGIKRDAARIAFVVTDGTDPFGKDRKFHRVLAFYQGYTPRLDPKTLEYDPIGALVISNGYITHAWVHPEHRSNPNNIGPWSNYKLYRSMREFAASLGFFDLEPGDELTSKSYRAADARYRYRRAQELKGQQ